MPIKLLLFLLFELGYWKSQSLTLHLRPALVLTPSPEVTTCYRLCFGLAGDEQVLCLFLFSWFLWSIWPFSRCSTPFSLSLF